MPFSGVQRRKAEGGWTESEGSHNSSLSCGMRWGKCLQYARDGGWRPVGGRDDTRNQWDQS